MFSFSILEWPRASTVTWTTSWLPWAWARHCPKVKESECDLSVLTSFYQETLKHRQLLCFPSVWHVFSSFLRSVSRTPDRGHESWAGAGVRLHKRSQMCQKIPVSCVFLVLRHTPRLGLSLSVVSNCNLFSLVPRLNLSK